MEENEALVRRAWAAYDRGDEAEFGACLSPRWREYDAEGDSIALVDIVPGMKASRVAFPDKHTEIQQVVCEGNIVVTRTTTTATHTGRYYDIAPTGKRLRSHEISIHRIEGGLIAETFQETGTAGFYMQLTGRPAPSQTDNIG
ncbi:MAG TPA: ester cyclase [Candidatus Dormibacteraeota bacterium]|jgi:predicted ester cyclase